MAPEHDDATGISRRRLLGTGAAGAAGTLLGNVPGAEAAKPHGHARHKKTRKADVAIVGAGFAGLTAAREIERQGHSAIVLEARDRVGGRAVNYKLGGRGHHRARGDVRRADPGPGHRARAADEGRPLRHLRHRRQPLHRQRPAAAIQRHGPDRLGPAGPRRAPGPRSARAAPRLDVATGACRRPVDRAQGGGMGLDHAAAVHRPEHGHAGVQGDRPGRDATDLRRRARRALAPVRPLLRRRLGQRGRTSAPSSATSTPATAPRCSASRAARSGSARSWRASSGVRWSSSHRCGGSSRAAGG